CAAVDRAAKSMEGVAFAGSSPGTQNRILDRAFRARAEAAVPGPWLRRLRGYDWQLYERHILREVLELFAATDAWLLLGYDAWPGTPRGLDRYRRRRVGAPGRRRETPCDPPPP